MDAVASEPQYLAHVLPVWLATGSEGVFWAGSESLAEAVRRAAPGAVVRLVGAARMDRPVLVASHRDHAIARRRGARAVAVMEHGAGQSYGGDRRLASHPSYAGGRGRDSDLILAPNEMAAARWRATYPETPVHVIGATRRLPGPGAAPLLVVSFHWQGAIAEQRGALQHYRQDLAGLARSGFPIAGHSHPRFAGTAERVFAKAGIPFIAELEDVARLATVYAVDNSSTLWEMGLARPTIALNAPWFRRDVHHGLRFWSHAGLMVDEPGELAWTADRLLTVGEEPDETERRLALCADVIPHLDGAARAATILADWTLRSARRARKAVEDGVPPGRRQIPPAERTGRYGQPRSRRAAET